MVPPFRTSWTSCCNCAGRVGSRVVKMRDDSRIDFGTVGEADHVSGLIDRERRHRVRGLYDYGSAEELSRGLGGLLGGIVIRGQRLLDHLAGTVAGEDVLGWVGEVKMGPKGFWVGILVPGNKTARVSGLWRRMSALSPQPVMFWVVWRGGRSCRFATGGRNAGPGVGGGLVSQETAGQRGISVVLRWRRRVGGCSRQGWGRTGF